MILYADAHLHTNPVKGLGGEVIATKFREIGGWFVALVALPPYHYGLSGGRIEDYEKVVQILITEKQKFVEKGVKVKTFMGFHPAEVDEYVRRGLKLADVISLAEKVLEMITKHCVKGLLDGIGEVGRQHYSTTPARLIASELILLKALTLARDHDLPIHLHLEQGGLVTVKSMERLTEMTGLKRERCLFHHVDYDTGYWCEKSGLWHSIPAKFSDLRKALNERREYALVESDYIDDLRRPGVSSYPWDIASNINRLLREGVIDEAYVHKIMIDNIVKYYRVEPP